MVPRLGQKYEFEPEVISKPIADYQTDEYFELELPTAPAIMVGEEIVVEGGAGAQEERLPGPPLRQVTIFRAAWPSRPGRRSGREAGRLAEVEVETCRPADFVGQP
jgi:hypothetical protein